MASRSLDSRAFAAVVAASCVAQLPLLITLPGWLSGLLAGITFIAWLQERHRFAVPIGLRILVTLAATVIVIGAFGHAGRDTGAGLLATMLALKLLETRTVRDGRLVIAFALFGTAASFYFDQGPLIVALAALGAPLGLASLAYLAESELPGRPPPAFAAVPRLRASLRLLALSLPLALVGLVLFPRLASPLWGLPGAATDARTGVSDSMAPGDMTELFADDSPILRAEFSGTQPSPASLYWRGPVLWEFDGRIWQRARWVQSARPGTLQAVGPLLRYRITQEPTERRYVFALDIPQAAPNDLQLNADRTLLSPRPLDRLTRLELESAPSYRLDPVLPQALRDLALRLPDGFNPRARALAEGWRAEDPAPEAIAREALGLFNREFTYTLRPPMLGRDSVDDFLFATRAGFCEHFSSAFAFLMRAAGVPARVVLGYHGGWYSATGNYWLVANSDAHAWTEIWIEGRGWVRVDPTAAVAPERIESGSGGSMAERGVLNDFVRTLMQRADWMRRAWNDVLLGYDARRQQTLLRPLGLDARDWRVMAMVFGGAALLAVGLTMLLAMRHGAARGDPLAFEWRRLRQRLARAGLETHPHEGPQRWTERALRRFPASGPQLEVLSARYIAWRYAGQRLDTDERARLARELRRFRPRADS